MLPTRTRSNSKACQGDSACQERENPPRPFKVMSTILVVRKKSTFSAAEMSSAISFGIHRSSSPIVAAES